jgi:hypothetical protein
MYLVMHSFSHKIVGLQAHDLEANEAVANIVLDLCDGKPLPSQHLFLRFDNSGLTKGATMLPTL